MLLFFPAFIGPLDDGEGGVDVEVGLDGVVIFPIIVVDGCVFADLVFDGFVCLYLFAEFGIGNKAGIDAGDEIIQHHQGGIVVLYRFSLAARVEIRVICLGAANQ